MKLIAATASHLLKKYVNVRGMDDDERIIKNTFQHLSPKHVLELQERFGPDLKRKFNDLTYCQIVRIYARHAEDKEIFNYFLAYERKNLGEDASEKAVLERARELYNEFIYTARDIVKQNSQYRLHDKSIHNLSLTRIKPPALGGKEISLSTHLVSEFRVNNAAMRDIIERIFGHERDAENILFHTIIEAAKIERDVSNAQLSNVAMDNLMRTMAGPILGIPKEHRSVDGVIHAILNDNPELLRDWQNEASDQMKEKYGDKLLPVLIRAAIGYCNDISSDEEVRRKVEEGEARA